ncbi:DNA/RNA non-specific endonuclease [Streptomyces asoensis]|uniref:DNA/RNA non-specific endonuclease n=1 Tax=Streptomyces asoensis TaxID=249586 RepID=UPI00340236C9
MRRSASCYDLTGRLTSIGTADGLTRNTYTYNDQGALLTAAGPVGYADTGIRRDFQASNSSPVQRDGCAKGKSAVHYLPLDDFGRTQGMFACLNGGDFNYTTDDEDWALDSDPTQIVGTRTELPVNKEHKPEGYYGGGTVHRGHLLARQLGGDGVDLRNLVPLYADVNTLLMRGYEDALANRLRTGETIYYQVIPHYPGTGGMPDYLTLTWADNKKGAGSVRLDNEP